MLRAAKPSFAGNGLLERMRSTTFALFGIVTGIALGLVALAVEQDWSVLPAAPIPAVPAPNQVGEARVVAERPADSPVPRDVSGRSRAENLARPNDNAPGPPNTRLSGPRQLATAAPPPAPGPGAAAPPGQGAPPASPDPGPPPASAAAPPPAPESVPAPATPPTSSSSDSGSVGASGANDDRRDEIPREADVDDPKGEGPGDFSGDRDDRGRPPRYKPPRGGWKGSKHPKGNAPEAPAPVPTPPPAVEPEESADDGGYEDRGDDGSSRRGGRGHGHGRWGHGR